MFSIVKYLPFLFTIYSVNVLSVKKATSRTILMMLFKLLQTIYIFNLRKIILNDLKGVGYWYIVLNNLLLFYCLQSNKFIKKT